VVIKRGVEALSPRHPLIGEVLVEPDDTTSFKHVSRRDPALGELPGHEQLAKVLGVATIGLGPSLVSPECSRVGRLGDVSAKACALELLCDITPSGATLHRHITAGAAKAGEKAPQLDPVSGRDAPTDILASREIDYVEGELTAVDVDSSYDSHGILLELLMNITPAFDRRCQSRSTTTTVPGRVPHAIFGGSTPRFWALTPFDLGELWIKSGLRCEM
jgi:hypothetical protein